MTDTTPEEPDGREEELEAQLREIDEKAAKIRGTSPMPEPPDWNYKRASKAPGQNENDRSSYRGLGVGITLAYAFVGPLFAGWSAGWLIDRAAGTGNTWQTWCTVIGMFLGFIGVVVIMNRANETDPDKK